MSGIQKKEVIISTEQVGANERIHITDAETGEIIDQFWRERRSGLSGRPSEKKKRPHFMKLYRTNWRDIVKKKRLHPYEAGVFFMCLAFVGWESNFLIHPKTGKNLSCSGLAELIGVHRNQLQPTMESLNRKGLVAVVKTGHGQANHYLLNSNVVFWGSHVKDTSEHDIFGQDCPYSPPVELKYHERKRDGGET